MRIRGRGSRITLVLAAHEAVLMQSLLDDLTTLFDDDDLDDPVQRRLFPSAYPDDDAAEANYRSMTEAGLRGERQERVAACAGDLAAGAGSRSVDVDLADPDTARRWAQVLNDLRLALGTRLGVTEDDRPDLDPGSPEAQPWLIYHWLTAVQDALVVALMR